MSHDEKIKTVTYIAAAICFGIGSSSVSHALSVAEITSAKIN